jgi:DNA recombination protein RmuC
MMELVGLVFVGVALVVAAFLLSRRPADPRAAQALDALAHSLGQLQREIGRVAGAQEQLRQDVQRGREASVLQLEGATRELQARIEGAHRALAEVKALEQGRARQLDLAADSLKRLETIVAGSATRGAAGENILERALAQLPPDLLETNVAFGNKVVEYALRLPGGRYLPIDSKWTSVAVIERLAACADAEERRRLVEHVARDLRLKVREMGKYLDPERTLGFGLLAVPDGAYGVAPQCHADGYREGVLVVPYSLALPYVLAVYRLTLRFGAAVDTSQLSAQLHGLADCVRRLEEEVEGRLSRTVVQLENSRDALRERVVEARRTTARVLESAEGEADSAPAPGPLRVLAGARD